MPSTTSTAAPRTVGEYDPAVPLRNILKHPKNPRQRAVADDELVESVRASGLVQPIVVAPHDTEGSNEHPERYILIAGHRRLDALKKVKAATAPVIIRRDLVTEAQQIEAMLVENSARADFTPIEEAEGYHQLELLGYKPPAIAKAVGRDATTVRARLKLLRLSPATKKKVHAGQFRLEDAAAVADFAGDPDATARLEAATKGNADNFRYQLQRERRLADVKRTVAATRAKLLDRGAVEYVLADDESPWRPTNAARLTDTHSENWDHHDGCLGYIERNHDAAGDPSITVVCLKPAQHQADLDEAERERRAAQEQADAERDAWVAARKDAARVRLQTLIDLIDGLTISPVLDDLLRVLLPQQVHAIYGHAGTYQDAMGITGDRRWDGFAHRPVDKTRRAAHIDDLVNGTPATRVQSLVALLLATSENNLTSSARNDEHAQAYLDLLKAVGHPFCDVDNQLLADITGDTEAVAS